jgi:hypothetical protein
MEIRDRIIIENGRLKMRDGSSLKAYLTAWQKQNKLPDGTPVNVIHGAQLKEVAEAAEIARNWGA